MPENGDPIVTITPSQVTGRGRSWRGRCRDWSCPRVMATRIKSSTTSTIRWRTRMIHVSHSAVGSTSCLAAAVQAESQNPEGTWAGVGYVTATRGDNTRATGLYDRWIFWERRCRPAGKRRRRARGNVMNTTEIPLNNASEVTIGEPVNPANGDVTHDETDFSIPNLGTPLEMVRPYDSFNTAASGRPGRTGAWATAGRSATTDDPVSSTTDATLRHVAGLPAAACCCSRPTAAAATTRPPRSSAPSRDRQRVTSGQTRRAPRTPSPDRRDRRTSPGSATATATAVSIDRNSRNGDIIYVSDLFRTSIREPLRKTRLQRHRPLADVHLHGQPHHVDHRLHRPHMALRLRFLRAARFRDGAGDGTAPISLVQYGYYSDRHSTTCSNRSPIRTET